MKGAISSIIRQQPAVDIINPLLRLPGVDASIVDKELPSGHNREASLVSPQLNVSSILGIKVPLTERPVVSKRGLNDEYNQGPIYSDSERIALKRLAGVQGIPRIYGLSLPGSEILVEYIKGETIEEFVGMRSLDLTTSIDILKKIIKIAEDALTRNVLLAGLDIDDLVINKEQDVYFIDLDRWYEVTDSGEITSENHENSYDYKCLIEDLDVLFVYMLIDKAKMEKFNYGAIRADGYWESVSDYSVLSEDDCNRLRDSKTLEDLHDAFLQISSEHDIYGAEERI